MRNPKSNTKRNKDFIKEFKDLYKDFRNDLTEIQFWKLLQPKDALIALEASREVLKTVMDNIPQYIAWKDKELTFLGCNSNFSDLINLADPNYIMGKRNDQLDLRFKDSIKANEIERDILKTKQPVFHSIEEWQGSEGKTLLFDINRVPLMDKEGKIKGLLITYEDISERVKADLALKVSEQKYRDLAELLPDIIYEADKNNRITYVNPVGLAKFEYTQEDLEQGLYIHQLLDEDFKEIAAKNIGEVMSNETTPPHDYLFRTKNGKKVYVRVHSRRILRDKEVVGMRGVLHDITEKKAAELKLKESEAKLKELNKNLENRILERTKELIESEGKLKNQNIKLRKIDQLKNDFISMAAHELKTPLISISGYTEYILLKYNDKLNPEIIEDMQVVQRNIDRLKLYMDQLLDVMKIDEDKLKLNKVMFNVASVIRNCIDELSYLIKEKSHRLLYENDGEILINADKEKIFQVISNLLSNAIKFTPINGTIEIKTTLSNKEFVFEIKDNGRGLNEEELLSIFNKFESFNNHSDQYNKTKGSGLGLYISKGFIEAHGGSIWVNSEGLSKGTSFNFSLPSKNK